MLIYTVFIIYYEFAMVDKYQWDFRTYYYAARAFDAGQNPYDIEALSKISLSPIGLKFVYAPLSLYAFKIFAYFEYKTAYYLFLSIKCVSLFLLILLWKKKFIEGGYDPIFYLLCLFGFNSAIALDMLAGNISITEQLIIWAAFYFLLKNKTLIFGLLIVLAASLKITPILLLGIIPLTEEKNRFRYFIVAGLVFAAGQIISFLATPDLYKGFLDNAAGLYERGIINPSTYSLVRDPFDLVARNYGIVSDSLIPTFIYLAVVAIVLWFSWRTFRAIISGDLEDRKLWIIYLYCVVFAIVMPRFKNYSYIMLIVPGYYIIKRIDLGKTFPFLLIALILTIPNKWNVPGTGLILRAFWDYYPLVLAYGIWFLYLNFVNSRVQEKKPIPENSAP